MMLQPDQDAVQWNAHVDAYERVFEPLTDGFNRRALELLGALDGVDFLDVGAGCGGAALQAAKLGARVVAVDAAAGMVARMGARGITARVAEAGALPFADGSFGAALSSFGVVLMLDPMQGMAELRRVVRPGGRVAVVTWTEPERYEMAMRLQEAVAASHSGVTGGAMMGPIPAQLRFTDPGRLRALLDGFGSVRVERVEALMRAPSAAALAGSLGFAPGMEAMLAWLGRARESVLQCFAERLAADQGTGAVALAAVAHVAVGVRL